MATQCQMVMRSGGSELQNLGAVSFVWGRKVGLQTKNIIGAVAYKLYSLYFVKYMAFFV